jgi:hypothetical protein
MRTMTLNFSILRRKQPRLSMGGRERAEVGLTSETILALEEMISLKDTFKRCLRSESQMMMKKRNPSHESTISILT